MEITQEKYDALATDLATANAKITTLESTLAERDAELAVARTDAKSGFNSAHVRKRMRLMNIVARFFDDEGDQDDDEDDDSEGRYDAMTDRELQLRVIKKFDASFDDTSRSDDYVEARFDEVVERDRASRRVDGAFHAIKREQTRLDGNEDLEKIMTDARAKRDANAKAASTTKR